MSGSRVFWRWAVIGLMVAMFLLWTQSLAVGGFKGLLQVGEISPVRELIESQLGEIPLASGIGHDGQAFYVVGLELAGHDAVQGLDRPGYRFRRVLYPLASGLAFLDGMPLLIGMVVVAAVSMGLATGATALIAHRRGLSQMAALAVLLNPGVWLSVRMLTGETLALAMMMAGLAMFVASKWTLSGSLFAASAFAKELFLLTPIGLPWRHGRRALLVAAVPLAALALWSLRIESTFGGAFSGEGGVTWPLMGIVQASRTWSSHGVDDTVYLILALVLVVVGLAHCWLRATWLRWPIAAWSGLALISSHAIWDLGNNALRIFAPILVLVALAGGRDPANWGRSAT